MDTISSNSITPTSSDIDNNKEDGGGERKLKSNNIITPNISTDIPISSCTVDEALDYVGFGKFQKLLLLLSGIGFSSTTIELIMVGSIRESLIKEWGLNNKHFSLLSSLTFLGEILGGIIWGLISDKLGRKPTFIGTAFTAALFACLAALSQNLTSLIICRFLLGFAIGGSLAIDFIYFVEFVPANSRSFRTTFIIFLGICAFFYVALISFILKYGWRWFVLSCGIPNVLLFFGRLFWKWESPRFLGVNGKTEEALAVLNTMARWNGKGEIKQNVTFPSSSGGKSGKSSSSSSSWYSPYVQVFSSRHLPENLKISLLFFCQTFAYYAWTTWLKNLASSRKIENFSQMTSFICIGLAELPGLFATTCLLGILGRRAVLFLNFLGSAIFTMILLFVNTSTMFFIISSAVYFFIVGTWTGLYVTTPEQFPTVIRASSMSVAGTFGKLGGFVSPMVFGALWDRKISLEWIVAIISSCFILSALVSLTCKERKDARLEDV